MGTDKAVCPACVSWADDPPGNAGVVVHFVDFRNPDAAQPVGGVVNRDQLEALARPWIDADEMGCLARYFRRADSSLIHVTSATKHELRSGFSKIVAPMSGEPETPTVSLSMAGSTSIESSSRMAAAFSSAVSIRPRLVHWEGRTATSKRRTVFQPYSAMNCKSLPVAISLQKNSGPAFCAGP
jgi:hypothetical protein